MSNRNKPQWTGSSKAERRKAAKDKIKTAYKDSADLKTAKPYWRRSPEAQKK